MRRTLPAWLAVGVLAMVGCGPPSQVNIDLRRQNENLHQQINDLQQQHELDARLIRHYEQDHGALATLPEQRLDKLFTAHGLKLGRLTGGTDLDESDGGDGGGDRGVRVEVVPTDQAGDPIKAAGRVEIQAFDLALGNDSLIGDWKFDLQQTDDHWLSGGLVYSYVFDCPWQTVPRHSQITVRVTFFDELTQTSLAPVEKVVSVNVPPEPASTQPATGPSAAGL